MPDHLAFRAWPIFDAADVAIVAGVDALLLAAFKKPPAAGDQPPEKARS